MDFASGINALGFDIAASTATTVAVSGPFATNINLAANTASFFGVINDASFTSIRFSAGGGPEIGWDALEYGIAEPPRQTVPLPGTLALLGLGLACLAFVKRK